MIDELKPKVDPNTATAEELQQLDGVGPSLAERIMAARPFVHKEDLQRVNGIGEVLLQRWEDQLDLTNAHLFSEELPAVEASEIETTTDALPPAYVTTKPEEVVLPVVEPEAVIPEPVAVLASEGSMATEPGEQLKIDPASLKAEEKQVQEKRPVTRTQFWMSLLIGGFLCFLFSILISLGILAMLNGGDLRFAKPAEVTELDLEVSALNSRLDTQTQEIEILRERVGALEGLGERMSAAESAIGDLQFAVQEIEDNLAETQTQVAELESKTEKFTLFFEALRDLFVDFFPAVESTEVEP